MGTLQQFFATSPVSAAALAQSLWIIIALPLLGALINGIFGTFLGRANVNLIACASVFGSFVLSVLCFWALNDYNTQFFPPGTLESMHYALGADYGTWFAAGSFAVHFGLVVDHLSGVMLLVITGVGFLIHLYSTAYMEHDEGFARYFCYLNLFVGMMLTLVMADNMVLTFVGWEGVGFCSYLLIGFWYTDAAKAWAGRKAFVTNRIGDFAFVIGMILLTLIVSAAQVQTNFESNLNFGDREHASAARRRWSQANDQIGPLNYSQLETFARAVAQGPDADPRTQLSLSSPISNGPLQGRTYGGIITWILLLFLAGAAGKSAQLPLYVWLPDAMAGPTPVSALIHAATMVTAGVYLFCRLNFLLVTSPAAMATVALVGALTALFAALIAFAQDDIKKVLAYSTVSQLGFMFMGAGLAVFWAAVLHLVTHAFFKACLFLGAGSVMHGNGDETDIKRLGGLRKQMPITWITFAVATVAITGVLPFSGFFSKDSILHGVSETTLAGLGPVNRIVWWLGVAAAFGTAFYMTRLYVLTFEGQRSAQAKVAHAHESAAPMTVPLILLATLSVVALAYGIPFSNLPVTNGLPQTVMQNFLSPVFATSSDIVENLRTLHEAPGSVSGLLGAYGVAWLIALCGCGLAVYMYLAFFPRRAGQPAPAWAVTARRWAVNKFYVDELYEAVVLRPIKGMAYLLWKVVDDLLVDTVAVRGAAWVTAKVGGGLRYLQSGDAQSYAALMAVGLLCGVGYALFQVLK